MNTVIRRHVAASPARYTEPWHRMECYPLSAGREQSMPEGATAPKPPPTATPPFPDMVWIPGGTFLMGSDQHYPEEAPTHRATADGFWTDRDAAAHPPPPP